jgi:hypothetical protein
MPCLPLRRHVSSCRLSPLCLFYLLSIHPCLFVLFPVLYISLYNCFRSLCLYITWPTSSEILLLCSTSLSYAVDNPWRIWFPFHYSTGKRRSIHHHIKVTCYFQTNKRLLPRQKKNRLALWLPGDARRLEQTSGRLCFTGTHLSRQHLNPAARCVPVKQLTCMRADGKQFRREMTPSTH